MPIPKIRLLVHTLVQTRNEFILPLLCIEGRWYQISKQLFVQPLLLNRQYRLDRLLHGEKPDNAARRVISNLFPDLPVKHYIPNQKAINFAGSAPKRYHWLVAVSLDLSFKDLPESVRGKLSILGEAQNTTRAEKTLLSTIEKVFKPRLENLEKVAATVAA